MNKLIRFFKDEEGATAVEYGIMVALIAAVIIVTVISVGRRTNNAFNAVNSEMITGGYKEGDNSLDLFFRGARRRGLRRAPRVQPLYRKPDKERETR